MTVFIFLLQFAYLSIASDEVLKKIDFDDSLVEGVNKRPYDSLSQISDRSGKNRKQHLYQ